MRSNQVLVWLSRLLSPFRGLQRPPGSVERKTNLPFEEVRRLLTDLCPELDWAHNPVLATVPLDKSEGSGLIIHVYPRPNMLSQRSATGLPVSSLVSLHSAGLLSPFSVAGMTVHAVGADQVSERVLHVWSKIDAIPRFAAVQIEVPLPQQSNAEFGWYWYQSPSGPGGPPVARWFRFGDIKHLTLLQYQSLCGDIANGTPVPTRSAGFKLPGEGPAQHFQPGAKLLGVFQEYETSKAISPDFTREPGH